MKAGPIRNLALVAVCLAAACSTTSEVRTHFNKGVRLYDDGNYAGAAREYRLAIEEDALDFQSHFNLAMSLEEMGRRDLARDEYVWILNARPGDLRASANLAAMEIEDGDKDAGYARLQGLVAQYDTLAMPKVALATHFLREGRLDEAETLVRDALKRDESDIEANFLLGAVLVARGDPGLHAEARKAFETALKNGPNDVPSLLALAKLAREDGKFDRARDYYRRVVMQKRNSLEAHAALAEMDEQAGDLEEAAYQLWQMRKIDPKRNDDVSRSLVRIYDALRKQEEAAEASSRPAAESRP